MLKWLGKTKLTCLKTTIHLKIISSQEVGLLFIELSSEWRQEAIFQYPKIRGISDIRKWISGIPYSKFIYWYPKFIYGYPKFLWFLDIVKWISHIGNYLWISVNEFRISVIEFQISLNEFRISVNEFRILENSDYLNWMLAILRTIYFYKVIKKPGTYRLAYKLRGATLPTLYAGL